MRPFLISRNASPRVGGKPGNLLKGIYLIRGCFIVPPPTAILHPSLDYSLTIYFVLSFRINHCLANRKLLASW